MAPCPGVQLVMCHVWSLVSIFSSNHHRSMEKALPPVPDDSNFEFNVSKCWMLLISKFPVFNYLLYVKGLYN